MKVTMCLSDGNVKGNINPKRQLIHFVCLKNQRQILKKQKTAYN